MYHLRVYLPGDEAPRFVAAVAGSAEVLTRIPELLKLHAGCERIEVYAGTTWLFSVDCAGKRIEPK